MRDVLFRGKRIDNGEWVKGSLLLDGEAHRPIDKDCITFSKSYIVPETERDIVKTIFNDGSYFLQVIGYHVNPETVGQWTGLYDNTKWKELTEKEREEFTRAGNYPSEWKGKKIFDGDIVKDDWGKVYEVFFTTRSCSFIVKLEHAPNEYEKGNYRLGEAWCDTIRVIGNIHDNPELLQMEV